MHVPCDERDCGKEEYDYDGFSSWTLPDVIVNNPSGQENAKEKEGKGVQLCAIIKRKNLAYRGTRGQHDH
jgi:hypothetical protein